MHAWHSAKSNVHLLMGASPRRRPNIPVSFEDICMASHRIRNAVVHTACAYNPELSEITGTELYFKHEVGTGTLLMMLRVAACATWSLSTHKHTQTYTHTDIHTHIHASRRLLVYEAFTSLKSARIHAHKACARMSAHLRVGFCASRVCDLPHISPCLEAWMRWGSSQ
jgi:putative component of membrane protein insertase Oxa1/YidC/SpoIIIJ protein YidD